MMKNKQWISRAAMKYPVLQLPGAVLFVTALILFVSLLSIPFATPVFGEPFEDALAAYVRGDYGEAYRLFKPLAQQGIPEAQFNLGLMYDNRLGVHRDYAEAAKWYRKAAEQGNARGQYNLGLMYHTGQGVPQDYAKAAKWYRKAAEQGNARGQYNLGIMYQEGQGVPQDYVQAHMWFHLVASRSPAPEGEEREKAIKKRDSVASRMIPAQIAEAQRLAREWKPKKERK